MSSVLDLIRCPQCGYEEADYEFYCRSCEDVTTCRHCGYHESWTTKRDEEESLAAGSTKLTSASAHYGTDQKSKGYSVVAACIRRKSWLTLRSG